MQMINLGILLNYERKAPFVVYSKPNSSKMIGIFQDNKKFYTVNGNKSGFVFAPFHNGKKVLIPEKQSSVFVEDFASDLKPDQNKTNLSFNPKEKDDFERLVQKGVDEICNGVFEKVVLSRKETIRTEMPQPYVIFEKLKVNYPDAFCYLFFHPITGMWAAATPERLLKKNKNTIETVSLAGTSLYSENQTYKWGEKEIGEQQIVTDYIRKKLDRYVTDWKISKPYTHRAGNLLHLKTDLKATLNADLKKVLKAIHPTPAVCGDNAKKAVKFIVENENYNREYYAGYVGEWLKDFEINREDTTDLFVNLRSMKINKEFVEVFVGCGITKDSIPEKEFMETVNKSQTMKKIIF